MPGIGPGPALVDATLDEAARLRPAARHPPPPAPVVIYAVAGLPPAEPTRVNGARRKAA